jgi:NitT/TauT family transport system permease protein
VSVATPAPTASLSASEYAVPAEARARESRRRRRVTVYRIATAAILLAAWYVFTATKIADPFFFSNPVSVAVKVGQWFGTGYIYPHIGITLLETALSFMFGAVLGVAVGFALARSRTASDVFNPYIRMANALPRVVLAPIFALWLGLGLWSKVALGVTLVFFIVFFNTYQGIREVDPNIINNARVLGARQSALTRHVLLPAAVTWILSSLHTSVGFALVGAVVGEYLGASRGLGYVIQLAEGTFDSTGVFTGMLVLAVVVIIIDLMLTAIEDRLLAWKPTAAVDQRSRA